ncbi:MAG: type II secretion system protein [Phycisphaerae bacterium]|nr:type II secretion system protein [Phycisphaerae bacterium]
MSLIEVTVSVAIVGVMMVAALTTLHGTTTARRVDADRQVARTLVELLMAEIMSKEYQEPNTVTASLGREDGEAAGGPRKQYDDVDDYNGWAATELRWEDGLQIPNREGWRRTVEVVCVSPADFTCVLPAGWDFGVKRITVKVYYNDNEMASLVCLRGRTKHY